MIFILDESTKLCAKYLDDKSLDKQIKTIAQVLCNVHYILYSGNKSVNGMLNDTTKLYKPPLLLTAYVHDGTRPIDQWSYWARECKANYLYLVELGLSCIKEHDIRTDCQKSLKENNIIEWARDNVPDLASTIIRLPNGIVNRYTTSEAKYIKPFPLAMPKKYIKFSSKETATFPPGEFNITINSYRNYYQAKLKQKKSKPIYTNRTKPDWLET
jgi:hypothetical protein